MGINRFIIFNAHTSYEFSISYSFFFLDFLMLIQGVDIVKLGRKPSRSENKAKIY
jgi:hypothetical protein